MKITEYTIQIRSRLLINTYRKWIKKNSRVLDAGCGNGVLSEILKRELNIKVTCCDIENYLKKDLPFVLMDNKSKLPFADNSFDTVIAANVTGTYQDGYIPEAERILKNGGRLIVSFTEPFMSRSFAKNSSQQCQEAGFDSVDIRRGSMATLLPGVVVNNYVIARKTSHFRGSGKNWRWL